MGATPQAGQGLYEYPENGGIKLRVLRCGFRAGDSAPMAYIELVDRPAPVVAKAAEADVAQTPKASTPAKDAKKGWFGFGKPKS